MFRRKSADLVTHLPEASILDMRPLEAIEHLPSPGVLATHCRPELLPASVRESGWYSDLSRDMTKPTK